MSKIASVICELNPAHNGHKYIFDKARSVADIVIAVMSGNYVQRGECAIYDKYTRAKSALEIGADLVLELPFPWSSASAEFFAKGGASIAEKIHSDYLCFGSECGDLELLTRVAELTSKEEFLDVPPDIRAQEYRERLLFEFDSSLPRDILAKANDILGVEYIKNLKTVSPKPFKRIVAESASSIRKRMGKDRSSYDSAVFTDRLFDLEFYKLRFSKDENIKTAEASGGLGNRLLDCAKKSSNGNEMLEMAKTKQYTNARLRRAALYYLCDIYMEDIKKAPLYTNLLAANSKGREYLSYLRKNSDIEILTKPSKGETFEGEMLSQYKSSIFADSLYALLMNEDKRSDVFIKKSPEIF